MDTQAQATAGKPRLALFDNTKLALIALVVIGHIIDLGATAQFESAKALFVFIYSFHMPLFIFLSGLFVSREKLTAEKTTKRVIEFCLYGFLAKLLIFASRFACGLSVSFTLLSDGGIPWFMFALAAYQTLAYLFRRCNYIVIGVAAVLLASLAGYDESVGDLLYLSRIIVFFPFFWLGCMLSPSRVESVLSKKAIRIAALLVVVCFGLFCAFQTPEAYSLRALFTGRNPYSAVAIDGCFWLHRLIAYGISTVIGFCVLAIVPRRKFPVLTTWGSRTLQVYLLHFPLITVLQALGVIAWLIGIPHGWLASIPIGLAITAILSIGIIEKPLKALSYLISHQESNG